MRESVINAIKHGNREDRAEARHRRVHARAPRRAPRSSSSRCWTRATGFDPEAIANPLDPENVLKSSGRGIFFMRSFMDDVSIARRPEGGMAVRMSKKLA